MPFNNTGTAIIETYNDVGRDQHNNIRDSIVNIYSPAMSRASVIHKPILPFALPSKQPYRDHIDTILEIQDAFEPIARIMDTGLLNDLVNELSDVLTTTALAGRLMELMEHTELKNLVWFRRLSDHVGRCNRAFKPVIEEVRRYREGLKFTIIGPIWRRVLWSVMWHLSPDADIMVVGSQCRRDLAVFKKPLLRLLATHSTYLEIFYFEDRTHSRDLLHHIRAHPPLERGSYCTVEVVYLCRPHTFPFDLFATYADLCTMLPGHWDGHQKLEWMDVSDHQLISPTRVARFRSRPSANIVLEAVRHVGPYICYSDDQNDICPQCGQTANASPTWMECGCGLRFKNEFSNTNRAISETDLPQAGFPNFLEASDHYVVVERFVPLQSQLSTIRRIDGVSCTPRDFLLFLRHVADSGAPLTRCLVTIMLWKRTVLSPSSLDHSPNNLRILLPHLHDLHITIQDSRLFNPYETTTDIFNQLLMPQLSFFSYTNYATVATPAINQQIFRFFARHPSLRKVWINWRGWTVSDIRQLILSLPYLEFLIHDNLPVIETSDTELHSLMDLVDNLVVSGDFPSPPLRDIYLKFERVLGDTSSVPDTWRVHRERRPHVISWRRVDDFAVLSSPPNIMQFVVGGLLGVVSPTVQGAAAGAGDGWRW